MTEKLLKELNSDPFYCVAAANSAIINFGVVLGLGNDNTSGCVFVPNTLVGGTGAAQSIVRNYESSFATKNSVPLPTGSSGDSVICLKLKLEDINAKVEALQLIQDTIYKDRSETALIDEIKYKWTKQRMYDYYFGEDGVDSANITRIPEQIDFDNIDVAADIGYAAPISSWTPKIQEVTLTAESYTGSTKFTFIQQENGNYYKYVPVARVTQNNGTYSVDQLIKTDYSFSMPFWYLESIKTLSQ